MSSLDREMQNWSEQKDHRVQANDQLQVAREVQHFATFKSKSNAESAAAEFVALGFEASVVKKLFSCSLMASRQDKLTDAAVKAMLSQVLGVVEKYAGVYDGFGAFLVEG